MKKLVRVGVDVGSKELWVAIERDGAALAPIALDNTADGHRKLIALATKRGAQAQVVLESTGVYGLELAFALHRAKRVEVMVANPRAITHFARASLRRSKTDRLDAQVILEYAIRMPFQAWCPPAPQILELRALSRRIEALTKAGARFNPVLRRFYQRLLEAGKPPKLALIALARKLLTILNAMARDKTDWQQNNA